MALQKPLLMNKAVVLAKIETIPNVDALPGLADAILVEDPDYKVDVKVLERKFVRSDLSPLKHAIGRKLASLTITTELSGNGTQNTGLLANEPRVGRLIRACGYSQTAVRGAGTVGAITPATSNTSPAIAWAASGENTLKDEVPYTLTVVAAGASGAAKLRVSGGKLGYDETVIASETFTGSVTGAGATVTMTVDATDPLAVDYTVGGVFHAGDVVKAVVGGKSFTLPVTGAHTNLNGIASALAALIDADTRLTASATGAVVSVTFEGAAAGVTATSGVTAVALGNSSAAITPTWAGSLVLGDSYTVWVSPTGFRFDPVSDDFETITLYAYFDGLFHKLTGSMGSFSLKAEAGDYGKLEFEFTGQYYDPTDAEMPDDPQYEDVVPPQVELAQLGWGSSIAALAVNSFGFEQANEINPRPSVNGPDGYEGVRLTGRNPNGSFDPEAVLVATEDFWGQLAAGTTKEFQMRFGTEAGNMVWFKADKTQLSGIEYSDRDGIRVMDSKLGFKRNRGDDEVRWLFC